MINKDFKRSKHPAQLLACLRKHPAQLLACLQYSPCSTACLLTVRTLLNCLPAYSMHPAQLFAYVPRSESIELPADLRTWNPSVPADLRTWNPSVPTYRRTWNASFLRMYALFFHCTYVPSGIDDFKTSEITQAVRSIDLNMRRRDLNPSVDSPYLDLDITPKRS
jgi:hypothetical protein